MKRSLILSLALAGSVLVSNLVAAEGDLNPVNAFSNIHKIPSDKLSLLSSVTMEKEGLKEYIFSVEGYPVKGVLFETNDGYLIPGNFFTKDGINIYQREFQEINKEYLENQENLEKSKQKKEYEAKKVEMAKKAVSVKAFIKTIEDGVYGDIVRAIPGNPSATETLYLFTDPLCPYCQMYETGVDRNGSPTVGYGLKADLERFKEVKVVMYPLYMLPGHDTSPQRAFYFNEMSKDVKTQEEMLKLLSIASHGDISAIDVDVKGEDFIKYNEMIKDKEKGIMSSGIVTGTPNMFTSEGLDPRYK